MTRYEDRQRRYRLGLLSEQVAATYLVMKGYAILDRRFKSKVGEIDLIAVRGRRLAFVEVKYRQSLEDALEALTPRQVQRCIRASQAWQAKHQRYQSHDPHLDLIAIRPWKMPRHFRDILN